MVTPIGHYQSERQWLPIALLGVAIATIANDLRLSAAWTPEWKRAIPAAIAVFAFAVLTKGDRSALGVGQAIQPLRYWLKVGAILAVMLVAIGLGGVSLLALDILQSDTAIIVVTAPQNFLSLLVPFCVTAPVLEETIYRLILCVPIARFSPAGAIIASGATFAGLHFVYGNPGLDNFLAGYLLAWIYLRSGSIFVPILFHAGGNAIILCLQLAYWYVINT